MSFSCEIQNICENKFEVGYVDKKKDKSTDFELSPREGWVYRIMIIVERVSRDQSFTSISVQEMEFRFEQIWSFVYCCHAH